MPQGLQGETYEQIERAAVKHVVYLFRKNPKEALGLTCGPLLRQCVQHFRNRLGGQASEPKL